ncbi:MAG: RND transporter [Deltaproteobacteria bacterium HGW-Deltaproteobacteria-14]|jgi:NodT family efflux transporter outer membrane factor (OMF) lipoprotein|nr:MAG: RND transporter [Deltaproteobacteria bacterium HGW-Deltaproteobacteria-14]
MSDCFHISSRRRDALMVALGALGLSSCAVHSVDATPEAPVAIPERFANDGGAASIPLGGASEERIETPDRWWRAFGDPQLDGLVDQALSDNLDLRRGWTRLAQAQAVARGAAAASWPQISADAGVSGQRTVFNVGGPVGLISNTSSTYSIGLSARYEVDLWRKIASTEDAMALDVRATREDLETVAMTISGRVAELWLAIVGERAGLALLDEQEAVTRQFVGLVEARFGQGLASALEVFQQRQQLAALGAQRPLIEARIATSQQQLAVLLGEAPSAAPEVARATLPPAPPAPPSALPADLLGRRPDVRAAQLRVVAADYRVGAAIADRYPSLALSGRIGVQAADLADFIDSWIWSLAASLTAPLFDGGRRSAEVDRAEAAMQDLLLGYGQVVLQALLDVDNALVSEARQRENVALQQRQLELARQSLAEAQSRYANGLTDYLNVLTSLRTAQQSEQALLAAERQLLGYRVQLYRALGGAWTRDLKAPSHAHGGDR